MTVGLMLDVDGVIADTETVNAQASVEVFRMLYGAEVHPDDFRPFIGAGADRYLLGVAEKHGIHINVQEAALRRLDNFLRLIEQQMINPFPGVMELIQSAAAMPDFRLAVTTAGMRTKAFAVLKALGLDLRMFDALVTAEDFRRPKPAPDIYLIAAERMGLPPERCIVIEDAPAGVKAACAAGVLPVAVTHTTSAELLHEAGWIVDNLSLLHPDLLRRLSAQHVAQRAAAIGDLAQAAAS